MRCMNRILTNFWHISPREKGPMGSNTHPCNRFRIKSEKSKEWHITSLQSSENRM
jgi:hypothetical protein